MRELELYIHIPFCVRKCAYCDFLSYAAGASEIEDYMQALYSEIETVSKRYKDRRVTTVFIGGGTPSSVTYSYMIRLMDKIRECFFLSNAAEITMEMNPGTADFESMRAYKRAGINRLSIGLQSANDEELKCLGRIHSFRDFLESYDMARKCGFDNVNVDIMSALPGQSVASYEQTLKKVTALRPEHISAYSLIVEEGTAFYERYHADVICQQEGRHPQFLPEEEDERLMYALTKELLEAHGYRRYEISNYAQPGKECQHNIGYWTRKDYLGFGLGAASLVDEIRFTNTRGMQEYLQMYRRQDFCYDTFDMLTKNNRIEEFMFLGLRLTDGISRDEFEKQFGIAIEGIYGDVLAKYMNMGMMYASEGRIALTEEGINVSNVILADFLLEE